MARALVFSATWRYTDDWSCHMATDTTDTFLPYMSWATLDSIIEQFRTGGLPGKIDRSVLPSRSGGDQSQFLRAATRFGFTDDDGVPTERLRTYVTEPEARPALMKTILHECYPDVVALPTDATPAQLNEAFRDLGLEGDTGRKAQTFDLAAAKFAEIALSPHFKKVRPGAGGRPKGTRGGRRARPGVTRTLTSSRRRRRPSTRSRVCTPRS